MDGVDFTAAERAHPLVRATATGDTAVKPRRPRRRGKEFGRYCAKPRTYCGCQVTEKASEISAQISPGAERMRIVRERKRRGLRCVTVQIRRAEIDELIRRGYLAEAECNDVYAIREALHRHLDATLNPDS
jgi:hypothetical protein